jgi:hypothetical protein
MCCRRKAGDLPDNISASSTDGPRSKYSFRIPRPLRGGFVGELEYERDDISYSDGTLHTLTSRRTRLSENDYDVADNIQPFHNNRWIVEDDAISEINSVTRPRMVESAEMTGSFVAPAGGGTVHDRSPSNGEAVHVGADNLSGNTDETMRKEPIEINV